MPALVLLPGIAPTRTVSDRLELLTALINAPTFDPVFRSDVIVLPGDHPVYRWLCGVPECERPASPGTDFCKAHMDQWATLRKAGGQDANLVAFRQLAKPLKAHTWRTAPPCQICGEGRPSWGNERLCYLHTRRWRRLCWFEPKSGRPKPDLDEWASCQPVLVAFGECQVDACPEPTSHPIRLCRKHHNIYERAGFPGGAKVSRNWGRMVTEWGYTTIPITYADEAAFRRWCLETGPIHRSNGKLSLLGLRPLVKAEFQWTMFRHTEMHATGTRWPLPWLQHLAERCRVQRANSLADLDMSATDYRTALPARTMLQYLRLVYFTREDSKDAGFVETDHFGVRFPRRASHFDLTAISQRWLRDLVWDWTASRLTADPPRSQSPLDKRRRGCVELSAFLEATVPGGGHDPTVLTESIALDFITDQRHRAKHGLKTRGIHRGNGKPSTATAISLAHILSGTRSVLRWALETGAADNIGLDRRFIVTLPFTPVPGGRRSPFPDDVARAMANDANLRSLDGLDREDRGLRDVWEALVLTGRRCGEVLDVRLECIGRLNNLPMFWHDQTKVGNYDEAIRIPERLYQRIEQRQAKTITRFSMRHGRPPTAVERTELALFPRRHGNRDLRKGASYGWFNHLFRQWIDTLDIAHCVAHQARHTLATNLLKNGADLVHVKRYLGQISEEMAEHYVHLANTDPRLESALNAVWVTGPGAAEPGVVLSGGEPMTREEAQALAIDLTRRSTPADGGFCTFQPVVSGGACPRNLNCHGCDKFVLSGADLVYWHRKREQWRMLAERAPDSTTADYLHEVFEPTARAIDGLEKALEAADLLEEALALDLRRPQDYFGRVWATAFRAQDLAHQDGGDEAA